MAQLLKKIKSSVFFNKKNLFLAVFVFLLIAGVYCFFNTDFFAKKDFSPDKNLQSSHTIIQTPCREVSWALHSDVFKPTSSRMEKLNQLRTVPIDLILKGIDGNIIDLQCFRGKKTVIVHFWATWCMPCIEEFPLISQFAEENKESVFIVAVSSEPLDKIQSYMEHSFSDLSKEMKIAQWDFKEKEKYFPEDVLPENYVFDKSGLLRFKHWGKKNWKSAGLIQKIKDLSK